ncbi:MAG TPA: hypothetical protein DIW61_09410 [Candidatus Aminicenantes bacterium]|nr:hypothetical protein [Candidatus Aminicenantes bacterium]
MKSIIVLFSLLCFFGCVSPDVKFKSISEDVSASGRNRDMARIAKISDSIKPSQLSRERMGTYSDAAVEGLFEALWKISGYLPDNENYALKARSVFYEKLRRNKYSEENLDRVFTVLVNAGLFDEAMKFAEEFPSHPQPTLPQISVNGDPAATGWWIYRISGQGARATLERLPQKGAKIVMFMHPECKFATIAAKTLLADDTLGPIFRSSGFMLTRTFDSEGVKSAKESLNYDAVYIARKNTDFPGFSMLGISPTFYFVKDGGILYKSVGWSSDDAGEFSKEEFKKGLAAIGI